MRCTFVLLLLLALTAPAPGATTHLVRPDGTGDFPTIQTAIEAAAPGDTVALSDGVFTGNGNRDISFLGKPVVLRSLSGNPAACVIDAQGEASDQHRVIVFTGAEGPGAVVDGVTVRGGYATTGVLRGARSVPAGGGIYIGPNAGPTLRNCVITGNFCIDRGAGVGISANSYPTIVDCVISENRGARGGGLGNGDNPESPTQVNAIRTLFEHNTAIGHGGGLALSGANRFTDCAFFRNQAWGGGGFFTCGGPQGTTFTGCTFAENSGVGVDTTTSLGGGGYT